MTNLSKNFLAALIIVISAILLMATLFGLSWGLSRVGAHNEVELPVLAIAGVVLLLSMLALVSVFFAIFELDDKNQALGLPEGSIRAVIALSLIVLFAILVVYLYGSLMEGGDKVPAPATDFAKQLLVLVGTLVTSVAGFYFGSKTAGAPTADVPRFAPAIRGVNPTSLARGAAGTALDFELRGDRLDLVKEVKIVSGANQLVATDVVSNASVVKCKLGLAPNVQTGVWDLIVTDGIGRTASLPHALTIT